MQSEHLYDIQRDAPQPSSSVNYWYICSYVVKWSCSWDRGLVEEQVLLDKNHIPVHNTLMND